MFLIGIGNETQGTAFTLLGNEVIGYELVPNNGGSSYYTILEGTSGQAVISYSTYGTESSYSFDGINWIKGSNHNYDGWYNAIPFEDKTVLIANSQIAFTSDFKNWSYASNSFGYNYLGKINNKYLFHNQNNQIVYTTDFINSTVVLTTNGDILKKVFVLNNNYYYYDHDGDVFYYTLDGESWSVGDGLGTSPQGQPWNSYVFNNNIILFSFQENAFKYSSNFGVNNSDFINSFNLPSLGYQNDLPGGDTDYWVGFINNNNTIVAYSAIGILAYSQDLVSWTLVSVVSRDPSNYYNVFPFTFNNSLIIFVGDNYYYSEDGINWTKYTSSFSASGLGYTFNEKFFVVSTDSNYNKIIHYTKDGINWNEKNLEDSASPLILSIPPQDTFTVSTLKEVQISIGNQGSNGTAEVVGPVSVYTVPTGKQTLINSITVTNTTGSEITYDLTIAPHGTTPTQSNSYYWDRAIPASHMDLINGPINMTAGQSVIVFPSTVDAITVRVYGTESNA